MNILKIVMLAKSTRYGLWLGSGILVGLWLGNQYPDQNQRLWAMPIVALVAAIGALWSGNLATANWKARVEEALNTEPPKKEGV